VELSRDSETDDPACTTAYLGCWAIGTNKVKKKCAMRKIIYCTVPVSQMSKLMAVCLSDVYTSV
jgi:hypothetical protein